MIDPYMITIRRKFRPEFFTLNALTEVGGVCLSLATAISTFTKLTQIETTFWH